MTFDVATEDDAPELAVLRTAVARELTRQHGRGHWSSDVTEKGVLRAIRSARVVVAREGGVILGTFCLASKKPWAIDKTYFANSKRPLYLTDMAVDPASQRKGVGRELMKEAAVVARAWPADAIRLDAYEGPAGAGPFYEKCGLTEVGRAVYRTVPLIYYQLLL